MGRAIERTYVTASDGTRLYTIVVKPDETGRWPAILVRNPYVDAPTDGEAERVARDSEEALASGFVKVYQHCRGHGGSGGEAAPFVYERQDGLDTLDWIQAQPWYEGGVYLQGGSYLSFVHLSYLEVAPECVKAAALAVMPTNVFTGFTENGVYKADIAPFWYLGMYHPQDVRMSDRRKACEELWPINPAIEYSTRVYGYPAEDFDRMMRIAAPDDPECQRPGGYGDAYNAMRKCKVPVLLTDGWFEMYLSAMVDMWYELPDETREKSAMILGPWSHGCATDPVCPFPLPEGNLTCDSSLEWFLHVRDGLPLTQCEEGKVCFYRVGEGAWQCEDFLPEPRGEKTLFLAEDGALTERAPGGGSWKFRFDPADPARFPGGPNAFSTPPVGLARQPEPNFRSDVRSFISEPLDEPVELIGRARMRLELVSDCPATMIFARLNVVREDGSAWVMQEAVGVSDAAQTVELTAGPMAWTLRPGERIRLDVSSSNAASYRVHTNTDGFWAEQREARVANNELIFGESALILPLAYPILR